MIANVWEWTADWYSEASTGQIAPSCCIPSNPRGGEEKDSHDPNDPGAAFPGKVLKGGSHLCAENYCQRYRTAARYAQTVDTSNSHIGFRCIYSPAKTEAARSEEHTSELTSLMSTSHAVVCLQKKKKT